MNRSRANGWQEIKDSTVRNSKKECIGFRNDLVLDLWKKGAGGTKEAQTDIGRENSKVMRCLNKIWYK